MVAVTTPLDVRLPHRSVRRADVRHAPTLGVVPSASMLTGGAFGLVWFWIPLTLLIVAVSSIPSVIGFLPPASFSST